MMIPALIRSVNLTRGFLRRLVEAVPEELLAQQREGAVNHPLWIVGHLCISLQAIGGEMSMTPWLPDEWAECFGTGSVPVNDAKHYPLIEELLTTFDQSCKQVLDALLEIGEVGLMGPLPDEKYRFIFPHLGDAALQVLAAHQAQHLGQLIVWRRVMGLPPIGEEYL